MQNANAQSIILASRIYMGFSDVSKVVDAVDACFDKVDEVAQRLTTIDDSMRSTRADIAAFEARTNAMEVGLTACLVQLQWARATRLLPGILRHAHAVSHVWSCEHSQAGCVLC